MLFMTFYYNAFIMGSLTLLFHNILKKYNIEDKLFGKFSVNMMRSFTCATIAHEALINYKYIILDQCLSNKIIETRFENYHNMFLSYFIFDTIILWYQVYLNIEKSIRLDLLFHHLLAITVLIIIEKKRMFGITLLIGLSEGMSIVTGPKLLSMYYNNKYWTNIFIVYRLLYLIIIRMAVIWPFLLYFYNKITLECEDYKKERNILLVIFLMGLIIHAEISWLHNGRNELTRF